MLVLQLAGVLVCVVAVAVAVGLPAARILAGESTQSSLLLAPMLGIAIWLIWLQGIRTLGIGSEPLWGTILLVIAGLAVGWWSRVAVPLRDLGPALGAWAAVYVWLLFPLWAKADRLTVLGFHRDHDSVFTAVMAQRLHDGESAFPPGSVTGTWTWYPLGAMELIGAGSRFIGTTAFEGYTPILAAVLAGLVLPVAWVAQRVAPRLTRPVALAIGAAAATGMLPAIYFAQGAAPSLMNLPFIVAFFGFTWWARKHRPLGLGLAAGLCAAAAMSIYGISTVLWTGGFAVLAMAVLLAEHGRAQLRQVVLYGAGVATGFVLAAPGIVRAIRFAVQAKDEFGSGTVLGNLGGALSPLYTLGVDRELTSLTTLGYGAAAILVLIGVSVALSVRGSPLVLMLMAGGFASLYATLGGPYWVAKTFVHQSVAITIAAGAGAVALWAASGHRALRGATILVAVAWAAGIVYTGGYYLRHAQPVPAAYTDLGRERIRLIANGPLLVITPYGQDWAAYFLRDADVKISTLEGLGVKPTPGQLEPFATLLVAEGVAVPPGWRRTGEVAGYAVARPPRAA